MRDRLLNGLIVFTAILWAAWVVMLSASALEHPGSVPLIALPIFTVAALLGWFLLAMFKAGKHA